MNLTQQQQDRLMAPVRTAVIAMQISELQEHQFYDLMGQLLIAKSIAQLVPWNRPYLDHINAALWSMQDKPDVDLIDSAMQIYEGMLKDTPVHIYQKALNKLKGKL